MAYILMPQVEAMLRGLAEELCGDMTRLDKEVNQDEANLTTVLACLKPHFDPVKYEAIELFLNRSSSVNMRNKLSHGLMSGQEIQHNAPFLLKLGIDLFFNHEQFLTEVN